MEVGKEDQAGHRVEFLGRGSQGGVEMLGQFGDGEELENDVSKHALPTLGEDSDGDRGEQPLEGVEEAFLSRIDDVTHAGRNSFYGLGFSIKLRPWHVERKMIINSYSRAS